MFSVCTNTSRGARSDVRVPAVHLRLARKRRRPVAASDLRDGRPLSVHAPLRRQSNHLRARLFACCRFGAWLRRRACPGPDTVAQVLTALLLRLRGVPILLSPNFYLGDDFATSSWFNERGKLFRTIRPWLVRLLQRIWRLIGSWFMCASTWEMEQANLPPERCSLVASPAPDTPLANSVKEGNVELAEDHQRGPIAYIGRFKVWRRESTECAAGCGSIENHFHGRLWFCSPRTGLQASMFVSLPCGTPKSSGLQP